MGSHNIRNRNARIRLAQQLVALAALICILILMFQAATSRLRVVFLSVSVLGCIVMVVLTLYIHFKLEALEKRLDRWGEEAGLPQEPDEPPIPFIKVVGNRKDFVRGLLILFVLGLFVLLYLLGFFGWLAECYMNWTLRTFPQ